MRRRSVLDHQRVRRDRRNRLRLPYDHHAPAMGAGALVSLVLGVVLVALAGWLS